MTKAMKIEDKFAAARGWFAGRHKTFPIFSSHGEAFGIVTCQPLDEVEQKVIKGLQAAGAYVSVNNHFWDGYFHGVALNGAPEAFAPKWYAPKAAAAENGAPGAPDKA